MSTRREAREWAIQFLFQRDFNRGGLDVALVEFWDGTEHTEDARTFTEELVRGVEMNRLAIDERLQGYAENWALKRMSAVDRNVMRLALYEMFFRDDIPPVVSINEAVDIAKDFSSDESGKFVNGILDRARKDLQRPARTAIKPGPLTGEPEA